LQENAECQQKPSQNDSGHYLALKLLNCEITSWWVTVLSLK
jgi:hypothetical protein